MCGRFVQHADPDAYAGRYAATAEADLAGALTGRGRYNVAPTRPVLAVRLGTDGRRRLSALRWGLIPHWSKGADPRYSMINARAEDLGARPAWRGPWRRQRCLIPAEGFYEWQATADGKQPWLIRQADASPFAFAGLWDSWRSADGATRIDSCVIITTAANALLAPLHTRMPVIIAGADQSLWLGEPSPDQVRDTDRTPGDGDPAILRGLLGPSDPAGWTLYRVCRAVNSPRHDEPRLLDPIGSADV